VERGGGPSRVSTNGLASPSNVMADLVSEEAYSIHKLLVVGRNM
jgi:hypothetical protein